jgi:hypothetical protein
MSIVDSGIDNRKDDAGIALRYLPRLRRMNFQLPKFLRSARYCADSTAGRTADR